MHTSFLDLLAPACICPLPSCHLQACALPFTLLQLSLGSLLESNAHYIPDITGMRSHMSTASFLPVQASTCSCICIHLPSDSLWSQHVPALTSPLSHLDCCKHFDPQLTGPLWSQQGPRLTWHDVHMSFSGSYTCMHIAPSGNSRLLNSHAHCPPLVTAGTSAHMPTASL
jgi:hypothetical protein